MGVFRKEFEILLNYLGWGDPNPKVLTVGIEEAGIWCPNTALKKTCGSQKDNESDIDYIRRCIRENFNTQITPVRQNDSNIFPIAHPIAKIACNISKTCKKSHINWKTYRDNKLWTKESQIANINIYPLGKKSLQGEFPSCYKELFGNFSVNDYEKKVKRDRFKIIRSFVKNFDIKVIICYGKSNWDDFKCLFEVKTTEKLNNFLEVNWDKKIIFTRHFSRGFSNKLVEEIVNILKNWEIEVN